MAKNTTGTTGTTTAKPHPDLAAELSNDPLNAPIQAADSGAPDTPTLTAEEEAQLEREKLRIEALESGIPVAETPEQAVSRETSEREQRVKDFGTQYVFATGSRGITDPGTLKTFTSDKGTRTTLTGWVEYQLANGKLRLDDEE